MVLIVCIFGGLAVGWALDHALKRPRRRRERRAAPPRTPTDPDEVTTRLRTVYGVPGPLPRPSRRWDKHYGDAVSPRDTGLAQGRPADMPTRGTTGGSGQAKAAPGWEGARGERGW